MDVRQFFQGLGENTCSLQPALKNNAPGLTKLSNPARKPAYNFKIVYNM